MLLNELLTLIQESGFADSLEERGFRLAYEWEEKVDYRHNRQIVGFESNTCRIACYHELGGISILIGSLFAPYDDLTSQEWAGLSDVISYIKKRPIDWYSPRKGKSYTQQIIDTLSAIATDFESVSEKVLEMYKNQDSIAEWKQSFAKFMKDEFQRKYGRYLSSA